MRRMPWHVALVPEGNVIRYALPQRAFAESAEGDWQLQHGVELVIKHRICCHYTPEFVQHLNVKSSGRRRRRKRYAA